MVGQVASTAVQVDSVANQLAQASQQVGQASTQIASAIEEIARGASEQSRVAAALLSHMTELGAAIDEVVGGVERQVTTETPIKEAIGSIYAALSVTRQSLQEMTGAADHATATAREGGSVVDRTLASITDVRAAVAQSVQQVSTLGE